MPPNTDKQVGVVDRTPLDGPIHGRFQVVMRNGVIFDVLDSLEVLNKCFKLVVSRRDCLRIYAGNGLVLE